jgi:hypothetical protein
MREFLGENVRECEEIEENVYGICLLVCVE